MTKAELIKASIAKVQGEISITKTQAEAVLNALMETMRETLANKEDLRLKGLGSFFVRVHAGGTVQLPNSTERKRVEPSYYIHFKQGDILKRMLNADRGKKV